ncbi:MAG: hypothetical protein JXP48_02580 [Acidobacteria bacterium]|nr:hypothetical protein [Acidobacteriota bacterium]
MGSTVAGQQESKRKLIHRSRVTNAPPVWEMMPAHLPFDPVAALGKLIYEDDNLSINGNQSCSSCHFRKAGFADPENTAAPDLFPVSRGSITTLFGGRNAPTAAYASFSPRLHWDGELFIGGMFWDGRATGQDVSGTSLPGAPTTGDPLADQAKGPFLNPVEMALMDKEQVIDFILGAPYGRLFLNLYGPQIYSGGVLDYGMAYNKIAEAIAAFERSSLVNKFNSKFDRFVREQGGDVGTFGVTVEADGFRRFTGLPAGFRSKVFTRDEAEGLALFNADSEVQLGRGQAAGGMCYLCHLTSRHYPEAYSENNVQPPNPFSSDGSYAPVLTDFSYDNLGIPLNPQIAILAGPQAVDLGLGARIDELLGVLADADPLAEIGKFKVPSLRNVADTPPYGHNGFFPDLLSIVHFYNARDVESFPDPEVPDTVNVDELGNLGLSHDQEMKLVKFMETLSDR